VASTSSHTTGLRPAALRGRSVLQLGWLVSQGISIEVRILQLSGRRIVDHDRDMRMQLEDRSGAACGKRTLDGRSDRLRLVTARCDEHEMPGSADGSESLGDDVAGHVVDEGVVFLCRNKDVVRDPVGTVHARGVDVDVVGELRTNDMRLGLRMAPRQADVLVEQKCRYIGERESFLPMPANQRSIDREWRRARRQSQSGRTGRDRVGEDVGRSNAALLFVA